MTKCVLAGEHSPSYIQRLRKIAYESVGLGLRKKPHGFKLTTTCGNQQCIAEPHLRLTPWAGQKSRRVSRETPSPQSRPKA